MNDSMNTSISTGSPMSIFQTWMNALTKPNEQTFADIAASPNAKSTNAFLWVFVGSLVNFFLVSLVQSQLTSQYMEQLGLDSGTRIGFGSTLITAICGAPIGALISVVFFAVFTGVIQWVAKMFGGTGTFDQLAYALAAVTVPFSFISGILSLLGAIPYVGFCFGIVGLGAGIYALVLQVMAVKGVNRFGWGQALGSYFLPGIVFACCIAVVVAGLLSVLAPAINETFNQLNQSLMP
jgi:Flp pilus assembly pilin Flp